MIQVMQLNMHVLLSCETLQTLSRHTKQWLCQTASKMVHESGAELHLPCSSEFCNLARQ